MLARWRVVLLFPERYRYSQIMEFEEQTRLAWNGLTGDWMDLKMIGAETENNAYPLK